CDSTLALLRGDATAARSVAAAQPQAIAELAALARLAEDDGRPFTGDDLARLRELAAPRSGPAVVDALVAGARRLRGSGDRDGAGDLIRRAIVRRPDPTQWVVLWAYLADVDLHGGRIREGEQWLARIRDRIATAGAPPAWALKDVAQLTYRLGRFLECREYLELALAASEKREPLIHAQALLMRAQVSESEGDLEKADVD